MEPAPLLNNRYTIVRALGQGGMGTVYLVTDTLEGGHERALKTILPQRSGPEYLEAFRQEFSALTELRHPNVIGVHDFGVLDGGACFYFTMDVVDGVDFQSATRGLDLAAIAILAVQVCRGLEYIHARGYAHLDIKPENLLVAAGAAAGGLVKIMDFGLALRTTDGLEGVLRGTPQFIAPEQVLGGFVDARSDLYALGVTLYLALTEHFPYQAHDQRALLRAHCYEDPIPPSHWRPELPPRLETLLVQLLSRDPADRPASANAVIMALNAALGTDHPLETHATQRGWIQTGRLVGRRSACSRLKELIDDQVLEPRHRAELPTLLCIIGDPGLGKTRLIKEARLRAQLGAAIYCGAEAQGAGAAFGAWAGLLRQMTAALPATADDQPPAPLQRFGPELAKLAPDLTARYGIQPTSALPGEAERARLQDALVSFALAVSCAVPLVLALDDAQALDAASLECLHDLGLRAAAMRGTAAAPRLLLLLALSPGEIGAEQQTALAKLREAVWSESIELQPLDDEQVGQLVASMLPVADREALLAERIAAQAGGHPFYVVELMTAVVAAGCLVHRDGRWRVDARRLDAVAVPASVAELLQIRLQPLTPTARNLLQALSACGGSADLALLAVATRLEPAQVAIAAAELERRRLVERKVDQAGQTMLIVQPQLRSVVYHSLDEPRRSRLHRAILAELEGRKGHAACDPADPDIEALAQHALLGADPHSAVRYAIAATQRGRRLYFNRQALALAQRALPLAEQADPAAERELLELCISLYRILGDLPNARVAAGTLLRRAEAAGNPRAAGRAHLALGGVAADAGAYDEAHAHHLQAWQLAEAARDEATVVETLQDIGRVHMNRGAYHDAITVYTDALARVRDLGDRAQLAACHNHIGNAQLRRHEHDAARGHFEAARLLFEDLGDRRGVSAVLNNLAGVAFDQGRTDLAEQAFRQALEGLRAVGYRRGVAVLLENLGRVRAHQGSYREALDDYRESMNIRREIGDRPGLAECLKQIGLIARHRGDYAEACRHYREALALEEELGQSAGRAITWHYLGGALMEQGAYAEALEAHAAGLALCRAEELGSLIAVAHFGLAECQLSLGQLNACATALQACRAHLRDRPLPGVSLAVDGLEGALELAQGRTAAAWARLTAAERAAVRIDVDLQTRLFIDAHLAEALCATARWEELFVLADRLGDLARLHNARPLEADAHRLLGLQQLALGRADLALRHLARAWELARSLAAPELRWRIQQALGRAQHQAGDLRAASTAYAQAYDIIETVWQALPPDLQPAYLELPARAQIAVDARQLLQARPS